MNLKKIEEKDILKNKRLIVGFSGGKDSTALILWLKEQGYNFETVFCDTGWEHPKTYEYAEYINKTLCDGKMIKIKPDLDFVELIKKKKIFPSRRIRFCTQLLKIKPLQRYINAPNFDCVMVNGERAEESASRAGKKIFEKDSVFGSYFWRPLLKMTWESVIDIHKRNDIKPNPLYYQGHRRVGCYPCIYANKSEYKQLAKDDFGKQQIEKIRVLEKEIGYPWVIIRRTGYDISGIDELLSWSGADQLDFFESNACSSHYKLCE